MFVSTAAIDPASGAVSAAESRKSDQFGRVGTRVSDLRGYGGQLTSGLSPDVFKFRGALFILCIVGLHHSVDASAISRLRRCRVRRSAPEASGQPEATMRATSS